MAIYTAAAYGASIDSYLSSGAASTWMDDDNAEPCDGYCASDRFDGARRCDCPSVPVGAVINVTRPSTAAETDDLFAGLENLPF